MPVVFGEIKMSFRVPKKAARICGKAFLSLEFYYKFHVMMALIFSPSVFRSFRRYSNYCPSNPLSSRSLLILRRPSGQRYDRSSRRFKSKDVFFTGLKPCGGRLVTSTSINDLIRTKIQNKLCWLTRIQINLW